MKTRYYSHAPIASREPAFIVPFMRELSRLKFPPERRNKRLLTAYAVSGFVVFGIIAILKFNH